MPKGPPTSKCSSCGVSQHAHNMRRVSHKNYLCPSCDPKSRSFKGTKQSPIIACYVCNLQTVPSTMIRERGNYYCNNCWITYGGATRYTNPLPFYPGQVIPVDNTNDWTPILAANAHRPKEWAYVSEIQANDQYPTGYYLILQQWHNLDTNSFTLLVKKEQAPKEGEQCVKVTVVTKANGICFLMASRNADIFSYEIPIPTKFEVETRGKGFEPESLNQLIRFMRVQFELPDNEIGPEHLAWSNARYQTIKTELIQEVNNSTVSISAISSVLNMFYGNKNGEDYMPKVILTPDKAAGCYDLKAEFDGRNQADVIKGFFALLKATIPASDRTYDPATHIWSFSDKYVPGIKKLTETVGFILEERLPVSADGFFYEHAVSGVVAPSKDSLASKLIDLLGITAETLKDGIATKKAYRAKALELHPDRNNGDGSKMSELNSIWSQYNAT